MAEENEVIMIPPPGIEGDPKLEVKMTKALKGKFGAAILEDVSYLGELSISIDPAKLVEIMKYLHDDKEMDFKLLSDISSLDWNDTSPRFEVVYHLYSIVKNHRLRIKCKLADDENPSIDTVCPIWGTANWHEREIYDMHGIVFNGHPDLRRIYMPEDWDGFPLRKDYPLKGY